MINDGGPAFPQMVEHEQFVEEIGSYKTVILPNGGMTLLDWFASTATEADIQSAMMTLSQRYTGQGILTRAMARYVHAESMIAEKNKKAGGPTE